MYRPKTLRLRHLSKHHRYKFALLIQIQIQISIVKIFFFWFQDRINVIAGPDSLATIAIWNLTNVYLIRARTTERATI